MTNPIKMYIIADVVVFSAQAELCRGDRSMAPIVYRRASPRTDDTLGAKVGRQ